MTPNLLTKFDLELIDAELGIRQTQLEHAQYRTSGKERDDLLSRHEQIEVARRRARQQAEAIPEDLEPPRR